MSVVFNHTQIAEFNRLVSRYPAERKKSALLPVTGADGPRAG